MFGEEIVRYCEKCQKDIKNIKTIGYFYEGKWLFPDIECPYCKSDLSKNDKELLNKALEEGKSLSVGMFKKR